MLHVVKHFFHTETGVSAEVLKLQIFVKSSEIVVAEALMLYVVVPAFVAAVHVDVIAAAVAAVVAGALMLNFAEQSSVHIKTAVVGVVAVVAAA